MRRGGTAAEKIFNIVTTVIVAAVVVLAVLLVGVRAFGYTPFAVLSPSMSPKYNTGDLVYVRKAAFENIAVGDVITFVVDESGKTATHRVADIDTKNRFFATKGDANEERDGSPVDYRNVVGVVRFSVPKLGYISHFFAGKYGKVAGGAVIVVLVILFILPDIIKKCRTKKAGSIADGEK